MVICQDYLGYIIGIYQVYTFLNCHVPGISHVYSRYILFAYIRGISQVYVRNISGIYLVTVYQHIADRSCDEPAVMFSVLVTGSAVHIGMYW